MNFRQIKRLFTHSFAVDELVDQSDDGDDDDDDDGDWDDPFDGANADDPDDGVEWVTRLEDIDARYQQDSTVDNGFVRELFGGRVYEDPILICLGEDLNEGDDVWDPALGQGDDWRVRIDGLPGTYSVINIDPHYFDSSLPEFVILEVERR